MIARLAPKPDLSHQFIDRVSGAVEPERLLYDRHIRWLYSDVREYAPRVFRWLTHSTHANDLLARINFDRPFRYRGGELASLAQRAGLDLEELAEPLPPAPTWRQVFCRKIRYWETRPLPLDPRAILSPADSRVITGPLHEGQPLPIKNKFFDLDELVGPETGVQHKFRDGQWAIFRLTPENYHYNHVPVSGVVTAIYSLEGGYHSCNPTVAQSGFDSLSKNLRVVTLIDTEVPGGSRVGTMAMIEVTALLIGKVEQCYSQHAYDDPLEVYKGLFLHRGAVKSLFEPGSSTIVLLFEPNRISVDEDLLANQSRLDVVSRFTSVFGYPMNETQVRVRSQFAVACHQGDRS